MSVELGGMMMNIIQQIPKGQVATYGQIAKLAGFPRHARYVGTLLKNMDAESELPWHRVINSQGKISLSKLDDHGMNLQIAKLREEGVVVNGDKIDLKIYLWRP